MTAYGDIARLIKGLPSPQGSIELHGTIYFALRREGRNAPAALYARVPFCLRKSHARPRVQQAPGLPCALQVLEGQTRMQNLGRSAPRECKSSFSRHCERSEAIHVSACRAMDCLAALAMTRWQKRPQLNRQDN